MSSLRTRLLTFLCLTVCALGVTATLQLYLNSRHDIDHVFDAQLYQAAHLTMTLITGDAAVRTGNSRLFSFEMPIARTLTRKYHRQLAFQIISGNGRVVARSKNTPDRPFTRVRQGFSDAVIDRIAWRVYALSSPATGLTVQIADSKRNRGADRTSFANHVFRFAPIYAIPLVLLIWLSVRRGFRPLDRINRTIAERSARDLSPIDKRGVPREIGPLVDTLNRMFANLDAAMQRERDFVAHAAHEIRTPLAVLYSQAETVLTASDHATRAHAAQQIMVGVHRTNRLVDQLLILAEMDAASFRIDLHALDLHLLCQDILAELTPLALAKDIRLRLRRGKHPTCIAGDHETLALLIRNLVENAIKYTPNGGAVTVHVRRQEAGVSLVVSDTGPGILPNQRERVFQRFWRAGGSNAPGSGLGLCIVQRVAELHHACVYIADLPRWRRGTRIGVRFEEAEPEIQGNVRGA